MFTGIVIVDKISVRMYGLVYNLIKLLTLYIKNDKQKGERYEGFF